MIELRELLRSWRYFSYVVAESPSAVLAKCADELEAALNRLEPPRPPTTYVRPLDPPHIRHAPDSPLLRCQDDFGRRYLDSGPINPEDDGA